MALPKAWYSTLNELWGGDEMYTPISWDDLPPLDTSGHDGSFSWLQRLGVERGVEYGFEHDRPVAPEAIERAIARTMNLAAKEKLVVPPELGSLLVKVDQTKRKIATPTLCYVDLIDRLVDVPGEPGKALPFLFDSQSIRIWGLHLLPDGTHTAFSAVPSAMDVEDDPFALTDFVTCAGSFEELMHRTALENRIWYLLLAGRMETESAGAEERAYVEAVRATRRT